jgi:hypothetical protein
MESTPATATVDAQTAKPRQASRPTASEANEPSSTPRILDVERGPNWLFVRVRKCRPGDPEVLSLAQCVASALDQHFIYRVVLELEEAALPCDRLIEELRVLDQWIQDHHGVLRLCGLPSQYTRRFHRSHITTRFPLYHDREEAVWGGPHPCQPR